MTALHGDQIVDGYIARLKLALQGNNPAAAEEILEGVWAHIIEGRARTANETDADVLNLLDRIGSPETVAADAPSGAREGAALDGRTRSLSASDWVAPGTLLVAAIVAPFFGLLSILVAMVALIAAGLAARASGKWPDRVVTRCLAIGVVTGLGLMLAAEGMGRHWVLAGLLAAPSVALLVTSALLGRALSHPGEAPT